MKIKDLKRIIREELKTIKEQRPSVSPVGSGPKPMSPPNTSPVGSGPNSGKPNVSPVGGGSSGRPAPNTSPAFGNGPVSRMMSAQGIKPSDVDANIFEDVYNFLLKVDDWVQCDYDGGYDDGQCFWWPF